MEAPPPGKIRVFFDDPNKPTNLPDFETIISECARLGPLQETATNITGVRIQLETSSERDASDIWVKSGPGIGMSEAATQDYVARYFSDSAGPGHAVRAPHVYLAFMVRHEGYIVMEYVDGTECDPRDPGDVALVAAAVDELIRIEGPPGQSLGPVGRGRIEHPFFDERTSSVVYPTVRDLEEHINAILRKEGWGVQVDLEGEVSEYGLRLCPSDLTRGNFMKDGGKVVVAVDFGGYSFLPPSFFGLALKNGSLAHAILKTNGDPPARASNVSALKKASCSLALYGTNDHCLPERLRHKNLRREKHHSAEAC